LKDIKKIVVIGPECTGKSTLSEALANELQTIWVPEYAREHLDNLSRTYTEADLLDIARGQLELEDRLLQNANEYLICDTDLYVIKVWSEVKYGRCHPWILEQIAARKYDTYLLTDIDIPWQDDPLREHPQPEERQFLYNTYKDIVANTGVRWAGISGDAGTRLFTALKAVRIS